MQPISRDDRAAADADYRQAAGGDVAVDGSPPEARRLTGLINAVSELRGARLFVWHCAGSQNSSAAVCAPSGTTIYGTGLASHKAGIKFSFDLTVDLRKAALPAEIAAQHLLLISPVRVGPSQPISRYKTVHLEAGTRSAADM